MYILEKLVGGRRYRVAAQAVWDAAKGRSYSRQVVLGLVDPPPRVDLAETHTVGTQRVGDIGALLWVAEQLGVVEILNRACDWSGGATSVSVGEMVLAVATQRACHPGAKKDLSAFLDGCLPRVSCLSNAAFTGQTFHRLASTVTDTQLEQAQIELARTAVSRFELTTDVLAFDTTNFDTHIATTTPGILARRGHAKSKRSDLRVVGLAVLASETGHVPLLYRTYAGNAADQRVLTDCLGALGRLHDALDQGEGRHRPAQRTLVRDGGSWSELLERDLDMTGYYTLISLPLRHRASKAALLVAAQRGAMKRLSGSLKAVRAARTRAKVGHLDRTLVIAESKELLQGQKRGIAAALVKAKAELTKLQRLCAAGRIQKHPLESRVARALGREHLAQFVVATIGGSDHAPTLEWHVVAARRRELQRTYLGKRVLCTDRHRWSTKRIVCAFHGQWNVEELFRRAKKGGVVPWGPSYQWADASLRLHTFATVLGLMLVSIAKLALGSKHSARGMMIELATMKVTLVRTTTERMGRRPTWMLTPDLTPEQRRAVECFQLDLWMPALLSTRAIRRGNAENTAAA